VSLPSEPNRPPLQGLKVIDLTRLLPGPACTQQLADLGADVIKVEDTGVGDYAPPEMRATLHRNKRAVRIDLKQQGGVQALRSLLQDADVLVESFRPGVMHKLGLGYAAVSALNPRIVYCSISGYGQDGPLHGGAGHDINYCGYTGVASQVGVGEHALALSNLPLADLMGGGLTAAVGILAAVHDMRRTGLGRHVDIAMAEGVMANMYMPLATLARTGSTAPAGQDVLSGGLPCYGYYRTADGRQLAVGALERKFWDAFCDVLERPALKPAHRTSDASLASQVRAELTQVIASRTLQEWMERLAGVDCCVTPVLSLEQALEHPHFRARGTVVRVDHPSYGPVTHVASPVRMSGFAFAVSRHAPLPGQDTDEVLREAGMAADQIARLRASGAVA
jgi:crotonobetainyl-CoA:carnitine CoA-transferase CaiB-like acyl-CoA transferase